jgi:hypothetical protein
MKPNHQPQQAVPIPSSAWSQGIEQGAGIYFLDGRCHIAAHGSPGEAALADHGALLIAVVRFDAEATADARAGCSVTTLTTASAATRFAPGMARN